MQNVVQLTEGEAKAGLVGALSWEYNNPINVPQHFSAVCEKTTQNESIVRVQNLSATFDLTFYIIGGGLTETVTIQANDRKPWQKVHNFEGSKLRIANISQESASLQATLVDLS
ncbi:MAG: hypothetical protein AB3N28_15815 [Kordiimonas sp.]